MRAEIADIPDGEYAFEDVIEDDGVDAATRYWVRVAVVVGGDEVIVDFTRLATPRRAGR